MAFTTQTFAYGSLLTSAKMTAMQDNDTYVKDAVDNTSTGHDHDGTDSKKVAANNLSGIYTSAWTSIADGGNHDFAHGLGYSPTHILVYDNNSSTWGTVNVFGSMFQSMTVDATNVRVYNVSGSGAVYFLVVAW